jgi:hypothetical protein
MVIFAAIRNAEIRPDWQWNSRSAWSEFAVVEHQKIGRSAQIAAIFLHRPQNSFPGWRPSGDVSLLFHAGSLAISAAGAAALSKLQCDRYRPASFDTSPLSGACSCSENPTHLLTCFALHLP